MQAPKKSLGILAVAIAAIILMVSLAPYWRRITTSCAEPNCHWAPNRKVYVAEVADGGVYAGSASVIDVENNRTANIRGPQKWIRFLSWTANSRFAVLASYDQYGNRGIVAFDALKWQEVPRVRKDCGFNSGDMGGNCIQGYAAISNLTCRILRNDGELIDLDTTQHRNLLAEIGENLDIAIVYSAAWSPDQHYLAFIRACRPHEICPDYVLYLASGDGVQAQRIATVDYGWGSITWSSDARQVMLKTEKSRYEFDVVTGQLTHTPSSTATNTPTPSPSPTKTRISTPTPKPPTATPVRVAETRVVYHDGTNRDGVGIYLHGTPPWLDILVHAGGIWYGPEQQPDDGINALPLPKRYRWEAEGGFGTLPNGEAWWPKSDTRGKARLIGSDGKILTVLSLQVVFEGSGRGKGDGRQIPHHLPRRQFDTGYEAAVCNVPNPLREIPKSAIPNPPS